MSVKVKEEDLVESRSLPGPSTDVMTSELGLWRGRWSAGCGERTRGGRVVVRARWDVACQYLFWPRVRRGQEGTQGCHWISS